MKKLLNEEVQNGSNHQQNVISAPGGFRRLLDCFRQFGVTERFGSCQEHGRAFTKHVGAAGSCWELLGAGRTQENTPTFQNHCTCFCWWDGFFQVSLLLRVFSLAQMALSQVLTPTTRIGFFSVLSLWKIILMALISWDLMVAIIQNVWFIFIYIYISLEGLHPRWGIMKWKMTVGQVNTKYIVACLSAIATPWYSYIRTYPIITTFFLQPYLLYWNL
jgi:hypothetical protein